MSSLWVSLSHHFALTAAVVFRPPPPCVVQRTGAQFRSAMFTERLPHVAPGVTETWSLSQETLCHPSLKCPRQGLCPTLGLLVLRDDLPLWGSRRAGGSSSPWVLGLVLGRRAGPRPLRTRA